MYKEWFHHPCLISIVLWMCENVNVEFHNTSRIPSEGIWIGVVCSTHFETRRDMKCYIWPLVVPEIEEKHAWMLPLTSRSRACLHGQRSTTAARSPLKEPAVGKGCRPGAEDLRGGQSGWRDRPRSSWECGREADLRSRATPTTAHLF